MRAFEEKTPVLVEQALGARLDDLLPCGGQAGISGYDVALQDHTLLWTRVRGA